MFSGFCISSCHAYVSDRNTGCCGLLNKRSPPKWHNLLSICHRESKDLFSCNCTFRVTVGLAAFIYDSALDNFWAMLVVSCGSLWGCSCWNLEEFVWFGRKTRGAIAFMESSSFSDNCTAGRPSSLRSPTHSTTMRLSGEITRTHAPLIFAKQIPGRWRSFQSRLALASLSAGRASSSPVWSDFSE